MHPCHDAAEKYLKAYQIANGLQPEGTHDLVALLYSCVSIRNGETLRAAAEEPCRLLNRYYTPLKYPSHFPPIKREQACKAVTAALDIERLVVDAIGKAVQS